jgi:hypothetical protein
LLNEWIGCGPYQIGRRTPQYVRPFRKFRMLDQASGTLDQAMTPAIAIRRDPFIKNARGRSGRHIKRRERAIIRFGAGARKTAASDTRRQSST